MAYDAKKISKKQEFLPAKLEDLKKFVLIGREKLISVRAEIRAIDKIGLAKEVREQKQEEASMLAGALLDAEARMGDLLKGSSVGTFKKGGEKALPSGITKKQSHFFQTLSDNRDIIEQVKAEAKENEDLPTRTEVLRRVTEKTQKTKQANFKPSPIPKGSFDVIYADPPWKYEFSPTTSRAIEKKYPTMELDAICKIKVPAAKDCILFMWATNPKLKEAFTVLEAWGFDYRTNMVWVKDKIGMGHYARSRHELLLIAKRGNIEAPFEKNRPDSVIEAARGRHSEKPGIVYSLIEKMFPGRSYVELFSRNDRKGWTCWVNE